MESVAMTLDVAANDVCATEADDRSRRLAPEQARLREVAKSHRLGAKYSSERPFKDTAKLIRQEIAAAAKDQESPLHGVKVSVRAGWSTYTRKLDVEIIEVPLDKGPIFNAARVERELAAPHDVALGSRLSKRGQRIESAVKAIVEQYGYDRSDSMTDYYDVAFYASVTFSSEVRAAHRADIERAVRLAYGAP